MLKRIIFVICLLVLLSGQVITAQETPAGSAPPSFEALAAQAQANGEITVIVGLAAGTQGIELPPDAVVAQQASIQSARAGVISSLAAYGVEIVEPSTEWQIPYVALTVTPAGLAALAQNPLVTSIEPNVEFYATLASTIPVINADDVWAQGFTGAGQSIVVIDSGVDRTHPFFGGRVVAEACFSGDGSASGSFCPNLTASQTGAGASDPARCVSLGYLDCNHGTHVAGIAAGSGAFSGVARAANLISIMTASQNPGQSTVRHLLTDIVTGLNYAYNLRNTYNIAAVNMSLGGGIYSAFCDTTFPSLRDSILTLRGARIATVVAAGNSSSSAGISAPACISSAISVGATNDSDTVASFSNRHPIMTVFAPGVDVSSSYIGGIYASISGTSMATPHVAGALALLKQAKPSMTVTEFQYALENTGPTIPITGGSERRLDVQAALRWVQNQLIANNDFSSGTASWGVFPPDAMNIRVNNGVYEMYRYAGAPSASIINVTNVAIPSPGTRLEVRALLGNSSGQDQRVSLLAHDNDFSDIQICSFWLPAGAPLRSYLMQFRTSDPWTNATLSIYPAQANNLQWLRVDDVVMNLVPNDPDITWNWTFCDDPLAPGASGTDTGNLLSNGDFSATVPQPNGDPFGNWWSFYQINWLQSGGLLNLNLAPGVPAGLMAQNSGDSLNASSLIQAEFSLGNSSTTTRGQMTVIVHDSDFSDMNVCTFWIPPNRELQPYTMFLYTRKAWTNAAISFYPRTILPNGTFLLDNVSVRRRSLASLGTECYPYNTSFSAGEARPDGSLDTGTSLDLQALMPTLEPTATPMGETLIEPTPLPPVPEIPVTPDTTAPGEGLQTEGALTEGG